MKCVEVRDLQVGMELLCRASLWYEQYSVVTVTKQTPAGKFRLSNGRLVGSTDLLFNYFPVTKENKAIADNANKRRWLRSLDLREFVEHATNEQVQTVYDCIKANMPKEQV